MEKKKKPEEKELWGSTCQAHDRYGWGGRQSTARWAAQRNLAENKELPCSETHCFWLNLQSKEPHPLSQLQTNKPENPSSHKDSSGRVKTLQDPASGLSYPHPLQGKFRNIQQPSALCLPISAIATLHSQLSHRERGKCQDDARDRTTEHSSHLHRPYRVLSTTRAPRTSWILREQHGCSLRDMLLVAMPFARCPLITMDPDILGT